MITELELLSYPELTPEQEGRIRQFLDAIALVGLNSEVRSAAIGLRRAHRLKLPDAIICATAQVLDAELLSNDAQLKRISQVRVVSVRLKGRPGRPVAQGND